jgi:hypothetical protein
MSMGKGLRSAASECVSGHDSIDCHASLACLWPEAEVTGVTGSLSAYRLLAVSLYKRDGLSSCSYLYGFRLPEVLKILAFMDTPLISIFLKRREVR